MIGARLEKTRLRLGVLPLADAAPIVIAKARGAFARHGLDVEVSLERAWSAMRDKVGAGLLDGGQMLAPMPIAASLGLDGLAVPMVTALSLSLNGNAITVATDLFNRMQAVAPDATGAAQWAMALAVVLKSDRAAGRPAPLFAHVFPFSAHHYELRMFLSSAGIDPDRDVRLTVVPPSQMVDELQAGRIDGFCVGAPWSNVAASLGVGVTVATKHEIWNNSPEKVLGVTRSWAEAHPNTHRALIAALIETARWLDFPQHRADAARLMIQNGWVHAPADAVAFSLATAADGIFFHRYAATFPWRSHAIWFALQMLRWRQCWSAPDLVGLARDVYRCETYREAAEMVSEPCPPSDFKTEGTRAEPWAIKLHRSRKLHLGADLQLDGSFFDPINPLDWLEKQQLGNPTVRYAVLKKANEIPR
jgi:two-component system, oxyanion-binding sensor